MTYTIPMIPPSNNRFIGRANVFEYQRIKKQWAQAINLLCRPKPKKPIEKAEVSLIYYFADRRRRDPDNYSGKLILDGLTRAGIIADDSFQSITLVLKSDYDKQQPRTVIKIKEVVESSGKTR